MLSAYKQTKINYCMASFDIIQYMASLTGFNFERGILERIAFERDVRDCTDIKEVTSKQKDLITADLLFVIYTSPSQSASWSKKHGQFSQSMGSQTITDKSNLYDYMLYLYKKWDDPKLEEVEGLDAGLTWLP